jgi:hypothetical protein
MGRSNARQVMGTAGSTCTLEFAGTQVLESSGCAELKKFMNLKKLSELLSASTFASKGREMKHLDPMNLWGLNPYWGRVSGPNMAPAPDRGYLSSKKMS